MADIPNVNRQLVLKKHSEGGVLSADNFEVKDAPQYEVTPGSYLVKVEYLSMDPTLRIWATNIPQYMPPVQLGEVMRCLGLGKVVKSANPNFAVGDAVYGTLNWQQYALLDQNSSLTNKVDANIPPEVVLGPCGLTGLTAYAGLFEVTTVRPGEWVVVSGAAGATGSAVVQMAKIAGARVIGIAGGAAKCDWVKNVAGADEVIDYKTENVSARLAALTKANGGLDVFFDNVGGEILDAALENLNMKARVIICGLISQYTKMGDAEAQLHGPVGYSNLLMRRARMEGFIVTDYASSFGHFISRIARFVQDGRLKFETDVYSGAIEEAPNALARLFRGENNGKQVLKVL